MNQNPNFKGHDLEAPKDTTPLEHKLPAWVICFKCRKPPVGFNWLKPVSPDPHCRKFIHLDCIEKGLSRQMENQSGGRPAWQG